MKYVDAIWRNPSMDITGFVKNYWNVLLKNASHEEESIFLLGGCNANLINYKVPRNDFLDSFSHKSNWFILANSDYLSLDSILVVLPCMK